MRKSLLALILVGSLLVVAVTTVLAGNPAADSIPDVGSISVPAAEEASEASLAGVPPEAAADGLATAEAAGSAGLTGDPVAASIPAEESISVPANDAASGNAPTAAPPPAAADGLATADAAGPTTEPPATLAATTTTPTEDPTNSGTDVPPSDIVMVIVDSGYGQDDVNLSVP